MNRASEKQFITDAHTLVQRPASGRAIPARDSILLFWRQVIGLRWDPATNPSRYNLDHWDPRLIRGVLPGPD